VSTEKYPESLKYLNNLTHPKMKSTLTGMFAKNELEKKINNFSGSTSMTTFNAGEVRPNTLGGIDKTNLFSSGDKKSKEKIKTSYTFEGGSNPNRLKTVNSATNFKRPQNPTRSGIKTALNNPKSNSSHKTQATDNHHTGTAASKGSPTRDKHSSANGGKLQNRSPGPNSHRNAAEIPNSYDSRMTD
jgi:hypothetical protein